MTTKNKYPISIPSHLDDKNLHSYVKEVGELPGLDAEEEYALILLKDEGDTAAAQKIILANLWYVIYEAKSFAGYKLPLADLIQEGNVGLMKAVKRFSPEYKIRVSSYAKHWIRAEITNYVIKNTKMLNVATSKPYRKLFFKINSNKKHLGSFTQAELNSVAKKYDVKPVQVAEMEKRLSAPYLPFDLPQKDISDDGLYLTPGEWLASEIPTPPRQLELEMTTSQMQIIDRAIDTLLSPRAKDIVTSRWMFDEYKPTLGELGEKYGISDERIRQIEEESLDKIRKYASLYRHQIH